MWSLGPRGAPPLSSSSDRFLSSNSDNSKIVTPRCQSKMQMHFGAINHAIPLSEFSMATAGADGLIILWKVKTIVILFFKNYFNLKFFL